MANRKRSRIRSLWIVSIALVIPAGISYIFPLHVRVPWGDSRRFVGSISDGNFRLVYFEATLDSSYTQDGAMDGYADVWCVHPTDKFLARVNGALYRQTPIHYVAVGITMFLPLVVMLAHKWLGRTVLRKRRQLAEAIREIIRPSDRHLTGAYRRTLRRSAIAVLLLVAVGMGGAWLLTQMRSATVFNKRLDDCEVRLIAYPSTARLEFGESSRTDGRFYSIGFDGSRMIGQLRTFVAPGSGLSAMDFGIGGFKWSQALNPNRFSWGPGLPRHALVPTATNDVFVQRFETPWWAPITLFAAWPIIAFIRGPYRRAGRVAEGLCPACGYNLTGLLKARCPECGTRVEP